MKKFTIALGAALIMVGTYGFTKNGMVDNDAKTECEDGKGCHVYGKIKFVDYGEDYKVKFVDYGEDLKIKYVDYGENSKGKWKTVDYGEDFKIKIVKYGEDIKVKEVDYGEGC